MRTIDIIEKEIKKVIDNHVDCPPADCGDNKIDTMVFRYLSLHRGYEYKVTIQLVKVRDL